MQIELKWIKKKGVRKTKETIDWQQLGKDECKADYIKDLNKLHEEIKEREYEHDISKLWEESCSGIESSGKSLWKRVRGERGEDA